MNIFPLFVNFIPHNQQLYNTVGNYGEDRFSTWIQISKMRDWRYMMLILVHELVEYILCKLRGIKIKDINQFDIEFEKNRQEGNNDEPGNDINCPYRKEHIFATKVEKLLAKELKVDWIDYNKAVTSL